VFNAERLLAKMVGEVVSKGGSWGVGKTSSLGGLGGGTGLMTIIGLGVGAYEIWQQQVSRSAAGGQGQPPPVPGADIGRPATPPPLPAAAVTGQPYSPVPGGLDDRALATRMIQAMVAAAYADGEMDAEEEKAVLDRLRVTELTQEEKMFLLGELQRPRSIEELTEGIVDPAVAKTMYMLAATAITIDTEAERTWLDQLAGRLGISRGMQSFLEEQR